MRCATTIEFATRTLLGVALLAAAGVPPAYAEPTVRDIVRRFSRVAVVPGEVIVKLKSAVAAGAGPALMGPFRAQDRVRALSGGAAIYRLSQSALSAMAVTDKLEQVRLAVQQLVANPEVEWAHPNYVHFPLRDPNDADYPQQWHYAVNGTGAGKSPGGIDLPTAWDAGTDTNVVVAIIDTGIVRGHPDIDGSGNLLPGFDFISNPTTARDGDGRDADPKDEGDHVAAGECPPFFDNPAEPDSWHGSHVAGTIGAGKTNNALGLAGVNWHVKVAPLRVLGRCGGSTADIVDAIRWAAGLPVPNVPANPNKARVINMSLGAPVPCSQAQAMQEAIDDAVAAGTAVVVAAGNDAQDASNDEPASCNNVIAVAASDGRGHLVSRYSNFGSSVDIMAPGGDVQRDDNGDGKPDGVLSYVKGGTAFYNGTSMAAPHVAAVAAMWLGKHPEWTPAQLESELKARARPRAATECPQPCGAGLLTAVLDGAGPTPVGPVSISLSPTSVSLSTKDGSAGEAIVATVSAGSAPASGRAVAFQVADTAVARVEPASATTDVQGRASATVRPVAKGETKLVVATGTAQATAPVKVPMLPRALVAAAALALAWRHRRRARRHR